MNSHPNSMVVQDLQTFAPRAATGFDRPTLMWLFGGLTAIGIMAFGTIWNEIGSLREEVREEIGSICEEVKENRARITDIANSLTRIETILEERLPRN